MLRNRTSLRLTRAYDRRMSSTVRDRQPGAAAEQSGFRIRPVRLFLVGGCHAPEDRAGWILVGRDGRATSSLSGARFYPFSMEGYRAAQAAANALQRREYPEHMAFTARVVVTGDPDSPEEVVEAWRLERAQPAHIGKYSFE